MEGKVMADFRPRPYRPAAWLPGPHAQTIAGRLLRRARLPAFRRERVELPDGDFVDLDHPAGGPHHGPIVLVMHGLEGSARRGYAVNLYRQLARRGVRAVGLNFRSCSGELNRVPRLYHSGDTADIEYVLRLLADRHADVPRAAIGFSLGGNALLKLLGELGARAHDIVSAAAAVSVPYDLGAGADALDTSRMGRFYTRRFVRSLVTKAEEKQALFDDAATAPIHGFADAEDYYTRCSSAGFLPDIAVPTLLLHAGDDPFLPAAAFPHEAACSNACIRAIVTPAGGHVGFIEGPPWAPRFWAEETAAAFLASTLARSESV